MDSNGASERHQNNNLKVILSYVNYISKDTFLSTIKTCDSESYFSTISYVIKKLSFEES